MYEIVPATEATLVEIEAWLDAEQLAHKTAYKKWEESGYADGIHVPLRGFRCNWDSAKKSWSEGRARIDILMVDGQAVGFLKDTDILEIRPDVRGLGYGRILADFMVNFAYDKGYSVVEIEIAPETAEPFWKHMGFTSVSDHRGNWDGLYAYKILGRVFSLTEGTRVPYSIDFYTAEEKYKNNSKPFVQFSGLGERLSDGVVQLPERAYCFEPIGKSNGDYFVRIELDGILLHFDKAKYEQSEQYGVECDKGHTYFLDRIYPQNV